MGRVGGTNALSSSVATHVPVGRPVGAGQSENGLTGGAGGGVPAATGAGAGAA